MNKTITISYIAVGNAKGADGQTHQFATAVTHAIYVSSAVELPPRIVMQAAEQILLQTTHARVGMVRVRQALSFRVTS